MDLPFVSISKENEDRNYLITLSLIGENAKKKICCLVNLYGMRYNG